MIQLENVRVLVVEDSLLIVQMVRALLEKKGYVVVGEAFNGREAVEMTQELRPDIVVMDIQMPDMDGIEAARRINDICPTPVVILTAYERSDLVVQASEAGVAAYLIKPPNAQELERAIVLALSRFRDMMELRQRNADLDTFAHTVAHDLKNPLTVLIGFAELLAEGFETMSMDDVQDSLDAIINKGYKAVSIVDELLLLASLRREEVRAMPVDMADLVKEVQIRLANVIQERQAKIHMPHMWPSALGYEPWLEEVWVNYLDNAIKYGGDPPEVTLGSTPLDNGLVRFWVQDNGVGLSEEEMAVIFKPLVRVQAVRVQGNGLGLSIVRQIVEKLGGRVGVESTGAPGEGSRFYFDLPRGDAAGSD
jgi:two-component system, sensor histidine kinase and response regulator